MEMEVKTAERAARSARRRGVAGGAGNSFPAAGIMGKRRPLASLLHGFLGALPMEMGSMGEAKTWLLVAEIRGCSSTPRVRFPPFIYLLGFPSPPFRVPPKRAYRPCPNSDWADLGLKIFVWKIVTTFVRARSPFDVIFEGQTDNLRKKFSDRFQESPN